ncbi:MAG: S41 family peptidase [Phycisphaerales bacterium]
MHRLRAWLRPIPLLCASAWTTACDTAPAEANSAAGGAAAVRASSMDLTTVGKGGPAFASVAPDAGGTPPSLPPAATAELRGSETFDAVWTIVRDTHFDPTLGGVDWEAVKVELAPKAASAASRGELRDVLMAMLGRLGQSHFSILPAELRAGREDAGVDATATGPRAGVQPGPGSASSAPVASDDNHREGGDGTLGLDVRLVDGAAVVIAVEPGTPADRAGIRTGWIVERVDGRTVADEVAKVPAELNGSWRTFHMNQVASELVSGEVGATVHLRLRNGADEVVEIDAVFAPPAGEVVQLGDLPTFHARNEARSITPREFEQALGDAAARGERHGAREIGLIGFNIWMIPVARPFHEAVDRFRGADGIIIDLRGNPGGVGAMAMGIAGHFCDQPISLGTMKSRGGEIKFLVNPRRMTAQGAITEPFAKPVAILVDEMTGSTSEIFAGGLQSQHRVRVFGRTSAGAALPAHMTRLPNGDSLLHAVADFTTADGTRLEGRGVVPDEVVPLTRADLLAGRDATLLAAVKGIEGRPEQRD